VSPPRHILLVSALGLAAIAACYTGPDIGAAKVSGASPTDPAGTNTVANGLPCDVATIIQQKCVSCHGSPPRTGAKSTIASRDDLLSDWEGRPLGVVSLERMRDTAAPMPPEGLLSEAEIATFAKWVDEGMAEGTCSEAVGAPPPINIKCTSGRFWTEGDDEGDELMTPGQACISCHTKENLEHSSKKKDDEEEDEEEDELEAPAFTAAGTVYPSLHEPDDCFGLGSGAQIILTGADGKKQTLTVNRAGNFMTELPLVLPYKASVVRNGKTRAMKTAQEDGDCNGCHTAEGGDAPGRIIAP
jgi:mono/diheme cytochrome c family protein